MKWIWIERDVVIAVHHEQLAEHGGSPGVRDEGLLDSALARPLNLAGYGEPDVAALAAAYGFGVARNHPFIDGNKRTAAVLTRLFVLLNGFDIKATDVEVVIAFLQLAAGKMSEDELALWVRQHLVEAKE